VAKALRVGKTASHRPHFTAISGYEVKCRRAFYETLTSRKMMLDRGRNLLLHPPVESKSYNPMGSKVARNCSVSRKRWRCSKKTHLIS
jgi:hypothetical protein